MNATISTRKKRLGPTLAAFLVVGVLIGAVIVFLALLQRRPQTRGTSPQAIANASSTPPTAHVETDGLDMSLRIISGPYFLSELLAVDMTLSNPTRTAYHTIGVPKVAPCGYSVLYASLTGGNGPSFSIPAEHFNLGHACGPGPSEYDLPSGQTITMRQYIPLEESGLVTLNVRAVFAPATYPNTEPFPQHLLTLQLTVAPQIPEDRTISVHLQGADVQVAIPQVMHPQVAYIYSANCQQPGDCGNYLWQFVPTNVVNFSDSSYRIGPWLYAIGVPGYAIVVRKS